MKQEDFHQREEILSPEEEIELRTALDRALRENAELRQELKRKNEQIAQLKKAVYGQKSEKTEYVMEDGEQLSLFNEAECEENRREREAEEAVVVPAHTRKKRRTHDEMSADLPVEEVNHSSEVLQCDDCGADTQVIGKEFVRDELVYVPARLFVRKHYAEVRKCIACGMDESRDAVLPDVAKQRFFKGMVPAPMISHSFCSPELLAHIVYGKYVLGLPLYRLEKDFEALGVKLSRATMANWLIYAAREWLQPLWGEMKARLLTQAVIHADETVVQVLREPGKKAKTDSRMWVYCAGEIGAPGNILFEYQPTRHGDHAKEFLGDYSGYLVCDGYDGYNKVTSAARCGCLAHVRRKFVDALPSNKDMLPTSKAAVGVDYCNRLFSLEEQFAELSPEERHAQRQKLAKPILDSFFAWLGSFYPEAGTKLSSAVAYTLNEKKYLTVYLEDPRIPISNNRAENAIRPFAVGRKQWLFCNSVKGAKASAIFYSLAATASAIGLNVEQYFTILFQKLPYSIDSAVRYSFLPAAFANTSV